MRSMGYTKNAAVKSLQQLREENAYVSVRALDAHEADPCDQKKRAVWCDIYTNEKLPWMGTDQDGDGDESIFQWIQRLDEASATSFLHDVNPASPRRAVRDGRRQMTDDVNPASPRRAEPDARRQTTSNVNPTSRVDAARAAKQLSELQRRRTMIPRASPPRPAPTCSRQRRLRAAEHAEEHAARMQPDPDDINATINFLRLIDEQPVTSSTDSDAECTALRREFNIPANACIYRLAEHHERALNARKDTDEQEEEIAQTKHGPSEDPTDPGIPELPWHLCKMIGDERQRLSDVLRKHEAMFSYKGREHLGKIKGFEFTMNTGDHPPIKCAARRVLNPDKPQAMRDSIAMMLKNDVIERIYHSEWASPVVMVQKPGGGWRFCVDFRAINDIVKPDLYPTPNMEELINCMAASYFKSSIDLSWGFWQVPVAESSPEKTTFIWPEGTFQHKRMPFGAKNSGATFQRAMDSIIGDHQWKRAPTYVDNIEVWTPKDEDHVAIIDEILTRFEDAGAVLNAKKCEFGCTRISYLGLCVDLDGLHITADRISAIRDFPEPKTAKEMLRFLGMASWCWKYIKEFAIKAAPLYQAAAAGDKFAMDDNMRAAFKTITAAMSQIGVMKMFEFGKPLIVRTDPSKRGVGAVLLQEDEDGKPRIVAYASQAATKATGNYSSEKMEAFAVVWALNHWRDYLAGSRFTLQTDNRALVWLLKQKHLEGMLARWVMLLQQFDYTVEHNPGKSNIIADALSRGFDEDTTPTTAEDLAAGLLQDAFLPLPLPMEEDDVIPCDLSPAKKNDAQEACMLARLNDAAIYTHAQRKDEDANIDACPTTTATRATLAPPQKHANACWTPTATRACLAPPQKFKRAKPRLPTRRHCVYRLNRRPCIIDDALNDEGESESEDDEQNEEDPATPPQRLAGNRQPRKGPGTVNNIPAAPDENDLIAPDPDQGIPDDQSGEENPVADTIAARVRTRQTRNPTPRYTNTFPRLPPRRRKQLPAAKEPDPLNDADAQGTGPIEPQLQQVSRRGTQAPWVTPANQKDDPDIGPFYCFLANGKMPETTAERRKFDKTRDEYVISEDGLLYRLWIDIGDRTHRDVATRLLVIPIRHRSALMSCMHGSPYGGGHFGFDKTYAALKTRFCRKGIAKDVREFVRTCPLCQRRNVQATATNAMDPMPIPLKRWQFIAMGIVGPTPATRSGNKYMLVCVDYLTRWPEVVPMPDQTSPVVAKAWIQKVLSRHCIPEKVLTDQGSNFSSELMEGVYHHLGITRISTTAYHPQTNGLVERFNRTLKDMLAKLMEERADDWDEVLDWAVANYRSVPSSATGETPLFAMTGRDAYLPIDMMYGSKGRLRDTALGTKLQLMNNLDVISARVRETILASQARMKKRYDKTAKDRVLQIGDLVKLRVRTRGAGHKLKMKWLGPYRLLRDGKSPNTRVIEYARGKTKTVNVIHLAPWYTRFTDV